MQGCSKVSFGPFILVYYNGKFEVSVQGYSKGS
jgi:hypothetical protein